MSRSGIPAEGFSWLSRAESSYGLLWCGLISAQMIGVALLAVLVVLAVGHPLRESPVGLALFAFAVVWIVVTEGWFLSWLGVCQEEDLHPLGLTLPLRMKLPAWWKRWPMAPWWLLHFLGGMVAVEILRRYIGQVPTGFTGLVLVMLAGVGVVGISNAGNTFLMLAVAMVCPSPSVLERVWRWRVAIDTAVGVLTAGWLSAGF